MKKYKLFYSECSCLAALTNLQKINSLPMEVQTVSLNNDLDTTIPIRKANKQETAMNINRHSGVYRLKSDDYNCCFSH